MRGYGTTYIHGGSIGGTKYGGYTYTSGTTHVSGGSISGGFYNEGHTTITGGTFTGGGSGLTGGHVYWNGKGGFTTITGGTFGTNGEGTIYNGGTLSICGSGWSFGTIFNGADGRILILGRLTVNIRISISITDIVLNTPIILGGDGYTLTLDDLQHIEIILPDGYTWKYDEYLHSISITKTTGIKDIMSDAYKSEQYFDINGRRLAQPQKGVNIIKTNDGKTKKMILK